MPLASIVETPGGGDYIGILPEIILSMVGMLIMALDPVVDERRSQRTLGGIALAGAIAALATSFFQAHWLASTGAPGFAFWNMLKVDAFSVFFS